MYCIVILYSTYIVHVSATKVEEVEAYGLVSVSYTHLRAPRDS